MAFVIKDRVTEPLYAIVPYFNPWRWKTREKHTLRALKHFHDAGAVIVLVEAAFGRREHAFADSGLHGTKAECSIHSEFTHQHIMLRTKDELWLKENLINIGAAHLPHDWQQLCWLDSDIMFTRPNWVGETIHKLQHYDFLQMFSHARDLAPNYEMLPEDYPHANGTSWMKAYHTGLVDDLVASAHRPVVKKPDPPKRGHKPPPPPPPPHRRPGHPQPPPYGGRVWPGLAWAATRPAFEHVGGLIDHAIWGGGDWHMAHALVGKGEAEGMMNPNLHPNYKAMVNAWAEKADTHIRQNVGVMEGSVLHNWHGRKTERGYGIKHRLLAMANFDPIRHLKRDFQGLYQLHDCGDGAYTMLRDSLRAIAKERSEDDIHTGIETSPGIGH